MNHWEVRPFQSGDFEEVRGLWAATEGLGVGPGDTPEGVARFLQRNPGLSFVAVDGGAIVGAILCGHDGRRGHVYHLAVARDHRREGLGEELLRRGLAGLEAEGIERVLIRVKTDNVGARKFWAAVGGRFREDLVEFSIDMQPGEGARARRHD